jgi:hypothetical protein
MAKQSILFESSRDAGCELSEEDHLVYCKAVKQALHEAYPTVTDIEVVPENNVRSTAKLYGKWECKEQDKRIIETIAQEVWERGEW